MPIAMQCTAVGDGYEGITVGGLCERRAFLTADCHFVDDSTSGISTIHGRCLRARSDRRSFSSLTEKYGWCGLLN